MKYSISEASRIVGVTRKTFYKHIKSKPISVERDEGDNPVIDASELMRVYGDDCKFPKDGETTVTNKGKQEDAGVSNEKDTALAVLEKELELVKERLRSERDNYEDQIEYLRRKLDESNSESRKLTSLITDQRSEDQKREEQEAQKEKELDSLKYTVTELKKQNRRVLYELKAQKEMSLFERLFGKKEKKDLNRRVGG